MTKRILAAVLLIASMIFMALPANAGGWASVRVIWTTVDPDDPTAWEIGVLVKQHDETPFPAEEVTATFVNAESGAVVVVKGEPTGVVGEFRLTVDLPEGGSWNWTATPAPFAPVAMTTFEVGNIASVGDVYTLEGKIWGGDCLNLASEIKSFPLTHSSGVDGASVDFGVVPAFDIVLDRIGDGSFAVTIFGDLNGEVIKKCREVQLVDPKAAVTTWEEPGNDISATESWTLIPSTDGSSASFVAMSRPTAGFVTITISDEGGGIFSPASITVPAGTTVTWVNKTTIAHTITGSVPGFANSGMLDPNQLFSQTFDEPGTYSYACDPHKWMTGTVVVTGS